MSDKSIQQQLQEFGLTDIEAKIYLLLLNKHSQTVLEISRQLHLPRTSIYDNSLKLIEKGLLEKELGYKTQKLKAAPIQLLESLIDREKEKVSRMQTAFKDIETSISEVMTPSTTTQLRYYHGVQGFQQMMWNSLSAEGEMFGYSQFGRISIVGEKFSRRYRDEMIKKNLVDRVIANGIEIISYLKQPDQQDRKEYQRIRFIDKKDLYISGDTTIYNNIFAVCYWTQGEVVGVEIENPELVKTQKSIFEQVWKIATPLEKYLKK